MSQQEQNQVQVPPVDPQSAAESSQNADAGVPQSPIEDASMDNQEDAAINREGGDQPGEAQNYNNQSEPDQPMEAREPQNLPDDTHEDATMDNQEDAKQIVRVSIMSMDEKKQVLKDFWDNVWADYKDGDFIDAMDTVQKWCLAQVSLSQELGARIHFDGWSSKHDCNYRWNSYKIAPFRKYSRGYTGQQKTPFRANLSFDADFLKGHVQRVQSILDSNFEGMSARETTQYLRGGLFQAVDFMMSANSYSEEEADEIIEFFNSVIRLIVAWLKKATKLAPKVFKELKAEPDLGLVDEEAALVLCAHELMGLIHRFLCGCHRCLRFYIHYDKNVKEFAKPIHKPIEGFDFEARRIAPDQDYDIDSVRENVAKKQDLNFGQPQNFLNYFAEIGGFDAILEFIKVGNDRTPLTEEQASQKEGKAESEKVLMPLEYMGDLTTPFMNARHMFSEEFISNFVKQVSAIITERLMSMTDKEMKELDKDSLMEVLWSFKSFLFLGMEDDEVFRTIEWLQLSFAVRFLKTTYLEKRLKGVQDLRNIIDRASANTQMQIQRKKVKDGLQRNITHMVYSDGNKIRPTSYLDVEIVKDVLIKEKVAETLFGDGAHPEILKRAAPILRFFCQHGVSGQDIIDMVWNCQQGKHEETVRVVYGLIKDTVTQMPSNLQDSLFSKISQQPPGDYTEMYIEFLKEFTNRALGSNESANKDLALTAQESGQSEEDTESNVERDVFTNMKQALDNPEKFIAGDNIRLYGLPILWSIVQDSFHVDSEKKGSSLFKVALEAMDEILVTNMQVYLTKVGETARVYYLLKAINNLRQGISLYPSACLLMSILDFIETNSQVRDQESNQIAGIKAIQCVDECLGFVDLVIGSIIKYDGQVKESLKQTTRKTKAPIEHADEHIFSGASNHHDTINKLFELLEFIVLSSNHTVTIQSKNIDALWQVFVNSPNFSSDQAQFLQFISKRKQPHQRQAKGVAYFNDGNHQEVYILTPEEQKHLFTSILCNPNTINYKELTSGLARCFHTYFRLINRDEGLLDLRSPRVVVIDFEGLAGVESLWQISVDCENERARDESMELLVDIHLRLSPAYEPEQKQKVMETFLDRILSTLADISSKQGEEGTNRKASSLIQGLILFLDRFEGKKPIKPELKQLAMQYNQFQPWTLYVTWRPNDLDSPRQKKINAGSFESLGAIRDRCAKAFGLELNEFHMRMQDAYIDPDIDDDSYVKDHNMGHILLTPNKYYDKRAHPKFLLAANQKYFDQLFSLLSKSPANLTESVWNLLQKLPINSQLHENISQLKGAKEDWNSLLDSQSTHKLLYSLKIIEELRFPPKQNVEGSSEEETKDSSKIADMLTWKRKFIEFDGFEHLLHTFVNLPITAIDSKLTLKCIESLVAALVDQTKLVPSLQEKILTIKEDIVQTVLKYIHYISLFTVKMEEDRGEGFEDIQAKKYANKLAKQKQRMQQSAGQGQNQRKRATDEDSDGNDDEIAQQVSQVLMEIVSIRSIVDKLFSFLDQYVFKHDKSAIQTIPAYKDFQELIVISMLKTENRPIRSDIGKLIKKLLMDCSGEPSLHPTVTSILQVLLIDTLPIAQDYHRRCEQYYENVKCIIECLKQDDLANLKDSLLQLIDNLTQAIQTREIKEINTKNEDKILVGLLGVLRALLQKYPEKKTKVGQTLVPHLLKDCLFEIPHGSGLGHHTNNKPKCKTFSSRNAALQLLTVLCRDQLSNLQMVLKYIREFSHEASWRTNKHGDWQITHLDDEKSSTGYAGLKNLGCICYMISLFQQLFMVPSFRDDLLAVDDPNHENQTPDENMFYQLQAIFSGLLKSEKQYVNPKGFCHAFKDWEGQPTNVLEQMDVEEFLQMFFDRLESAIKGTPQEKTIQAHFGGTFASEVISKGCSHRFDRPEPFLSIGVTVKNKKSLQEGLQAFIQGDMLEGDNAYHCATCDKKVDALKRTCVKELPRFMIVSLKRFEFDFDRMIRVKVNDYCEFPIELDMYPYTQEGLQKQEKAAKKKAEAKEQGDDIEENDQDEPRKHPQDYYEFRLKGIVVHTGTADSGHYYSFIREAATENGEKWYEFNDNIVSDFDIGDLGNECFGGEESYSMGMKQIRTPKWRNAYLVVYERKNQTYVIKKEEDDQKVEPAKKDDPEKIDDLEPENKPLKLSDPKHPIQEKIRLENQKYWQNKFLFANEYIEFVTEVVHYWDSVNIIPINQLNRNDDSQIVRFAQRFPQEQENQYHDLSPPLDEPMDLRLQHPEQNSKAVQDSAHQIFKFAAGFYLTILQRNANKMLIPKFIDSLKAYINNDPRNGHWLIQEFSNWEIIEEMFLQNQSRDMSRLVVGLIYASMLKIYDHEKENLALHWQDIESNKECTSTRIGTLGNFILILIQNLYNAKPFTLNYANYFQLLARFASLGPEARQFLLKAQIVGRCMDFYHDSASPYRAQFSDMSDLGPVRIQFDPDIGLPIQMDKKVKTYFQMLQERRRRQFLENAVPKWKYLMELVSLCVRHLKVGDTPTQYQLDAQYAPAISEFISSREADIFIPEAKFLVRFFNEAKRNRSIWAVCKAHCHYAFYQNDNIQELFRTVELGLTKNDFDGVRPYLCLLEMLLDEPHKNFSQNREVWLRRYMQIVKVNSMFFKWMEPNFDFIFKIVGRYEHVRNWFYTNEESWRFLVEWINRNQGPPNASSQNIRMFKQKQQSMGMLAYSSQYDQGKTSLDNSYRVRRLQQMITKKVPDTSDEADIDKMDLQDYKFVKGDLITLFDRKQERAYEYKVALVLDEILNLVTIYPDRMGKFNNKWQKCDTDKIILGDTYHHLSKTRTKRELYEKRLNPIQTQEKQDNDDSGSPTRPDGDKGASKDQPQDDEKDEQDETQAEASDYESSEDDQNGQADMCA